jgi:glycosyltransferase involved in cell wall biosynthesis
MKILFDGCATQGGFIREDTGAVLFHGGGEYAKYVLRKVIEMGYIGFDIVFEKGRFMDNTVIDSLPEEVKVYYVNNQEEIYSLIEENRYDLFYSALPRRYIKYNLTTTFAMVIHDLRTIELPWVDYRYKYFNNPIKKIVAFIISLFPLFQRILKIRNTLKIQRLLNIKNIRLITVSEYSKYSLLNVFPFLKYRDIKVFYAPFPFKDRDIPNVLRNKNIEGGGYFLMVSGNRYEKNIYRAIKAFDGLFSKGYLEVHKVVITGCSQKLPFINEVKNIDKFEFQPYLPEEKLDELFENAFAFVYPSLHEGFGYPPLKAMECGVPVLASFAASIPEVCGEAAIYFNPQSIDELSNKILQIIGSDSLYSKLVSNGHKRIKQLRDMQEETIADMIHFIFEGKE